MEYLLWNENDIIFDRYRLIKKIESKQGIFWKTIDIKSKLPRGLKILKEAQPEHDTLIKYAKETYVALLVPEHPNLNKFYSSMARTGNIINIVEIIPGKTLHSLSLNVEKKISYIIQIIEALLHLNDNFEDYKDILKYESFFHGDLHSENVIITEDDRAVLIDWGQAYRLKEKNKLFPTTAPEFHKDSPYKNYRGNKIDVFSLGVMIWNLFEGTIPYGEGSYLNNDGLNANLVDDKKINPAKNLNAIDNELYSIIKNMLLCDPAKRLTLKDVLEYFKCLYARLNKNPDQSCFFYLKKRYLNSKEEILTTADSLFEISNLIDPIKDDENQKAKIFELSVRVINENIYLFENPEIERIRERYLEYLNREGLWNSISEEKKIFDRNFYEISETDMYVIHNELETIIYQYLIGGFSLEKAHLQFYDKYDKSWLKHYYYRELLELVSRIMLDKSEWIHKLIKMVVYFCQKTEDYDFIFSFYYEYLNKEHAKKELNRIDLQSIRVVSHLLDTLIIMKEEKKGKFRLEFTLILIKLLEWGYKGSSKDIKYLRKYFYKVYCKYYKLLKENKECIRDDQVWSGIIVHYISFLLSYTEHNSQILGNKNFKKQLDKISCLFEISKTRYVDFELYEHFIKVYSALKANYIIDRKSYKKLVWFALKFSQILNDDFSRILQILYIENKITFRNVEIVFEIFKPNNHDSFLRLIKTLNLSKLGEMAVTLHIELKNNIPIDLVKYDTFLEKKPNNRNSGIIFRAYLARAYLKQGNFENFKRLHESLLKCNIEGISLFLEDIDFDYILFLIYSQKTGAVMEKVLVLLKDKRLVRENNIVKVFKLYYLIIELLRANKKYYDMFVYLENLRGISPDLLGIVDKCRIDSFYENMAFCKPRRVKNEFSQ